MLTLVIQSGGKSSRMGEDKALKPFLGKPLIRRVLERLSPLADEVIVTTNQPRGYEFLGLKLAPDLIPDRGALGGLYTALASAAQPFVAVVACDMPFASRPLFERALQIIQKENADVVIAQTEEGFEPFHALYRRETCLPAIQAALEAGQWKVISWFPQVKVRLLAPEETADCDPAGLCFQNLNTPDEFAAAERLAQTETGDGG